MSNLGGGIGIAVASMLINRSLKSDLPQTIPLEYVQHVIELPTFIYDGLPEQYVEPVIRAYNDAFKNLWYMMTAAAIIRKFIGNDTVKSLGGINNIATL